MVQRRLLWAAQGLAVAALLAACGGGGAPAGPAEAGPLDAVPTSAGQSATGMAGYLKALSVLAPEDREPLAVDGFAPPAPDDAEPVPVF